LPGKMNLFLIRRLYKYADASVSVSEKVQSQLLSLTTLAFNRYVINNPFDLAYIASRSEEAVDDFCYVDGEVYLVAVGRINTVKRYDLIIGAMNLLSNDRLNLIVIGEEENVKADTLLTMAVNKDKVHFLGAKENPYKYIKNSDVLILSSDSESFGNVLIESMVCGTPVIGARCGGPEEIICHDYSGILVDPGDVQQLARAIQRTAFDDEYKALLANNALSGVNKYDVHRIAGQYKKVLESCH
ncbi:MAG TPA: glycosyltransferase, partial [Gammaproteobacteria bacterium]|nr:glycosyltransferase [Gammaproteobacteria bacterium]